MMCRRQERHRTRCSSMNSGRFSLALAALEPHVTNTPAAELLSLHGAMQLVAAVISALEDNPSAAHEHLRAADDIAHQLGEDCNMGPRRRNGSASRNARP